MNLQRISLLVAEKLREIATRQGNVPFDRGDLRKSHVVEPSGETDAIVSANTPYARAVHDGRPSLTIKAKRARALHWKGAAHPVRSVTQPARKGNPWLARAVQQMETEGLDDLAPELGSELGQQVADKLTRALRVRGQERRP